MSSTNNAAKIGVLLVNLGTPDAPDRTSIKRYLKQFLSDPRVVEVPRLLWWCILNLVILTFRPSKLVPEYQAIWADGESPLRAIVNKQVAKLQDSLDRKLDGDSVLVTSAMTYGEPSFGQALAELKLEGIDRVLVLPLYPQYSATTTAATFDAMSREIQTIRDIPEVRFIKRYHNHHLYIEALAKSVEQHWQAQGRQARLLVSFHGIPQDYVDKGDPYADDCAETTRLLAERLGLNSGEYLQTYQSRVGNKPWLKPYTDDTMKMLGQQKQAGLDVICPGFSADCLETLKEIDEENREYFEGNGGQDFHYIPALNDSDLHNDLLEALVLASIGGWVKG